ncbi:MAG: helix-turn-helix transcriptional regulator [Patescibacteria group bacterium]
MSFSFKNNLYAERCGSMLTQEDLAKETNVSRQTINAIEQGRRVPSVYIALRLAHVLHTSVERIFPLPKEFKKRNSTHV